MRNHKTALPLMALLALPLAAQTGDSKPASVQGTVTNSVTGAPVPRVHVTLEGSNSDQPVRYGSTSGADGRFSFTGIPPGAWSAMGERVGFVASRSSPRERTRIVLKSDDNKTGIEIRLTPTGAITGRITNSDGDPVEGAGVSAESRGGAGSGVTDESGQFRIGGLAPGKYILSAQHGDIFGGRPEIRTDGTFDVHNATTYYPGVLTQNEAGKVGVLAGDETGGINIQLVRVPFVRVSGKVIDFPDNVQQAAIMVSQGNFGNGTQLRHDGSFETWRLNPGMYTISAEWTAPNGDTVRTGGVEILVAGSNIDHIELRVIPDSDIPGRLEFEDDDARQMPHAKPTVTLQVVEGDNDGPSVPIDDNGAFSLKKIPAGKYQLNVSWGTAYVKSIRLGNSLIDGNVLDLSNGSSGQDLSLLMSSATGSVSGVVQTDSARPEGAMVAITAADAQAVFEPRVAQIAADGTYTITGLPPGKYKLVAAAELQGMQSNDVFGYEDQMESIEIMPKEKVTKDLKLRTPSDQ
jgi:protocatechuate 3,4-dioxygenase beta subunit